MAASKNVGKGNPVLGRNGKPATQAMLKKGAEANKQTSDTLKNYSAAKAAPKPAPKKAGGK